MRSRHNVTCECGRPVTLLVSPASHRQANPLPVYSHDGTKIYEFRDVPFMRPPTPPEELVRIGELPNNADRFEPYKPKDGR